MPLRQPAGPEVIFSNDPLSGTGVPRVTPLADDTFVLAWDTAAGDIVAKHLDTSGNFTTGDFLQGVSSFAAAEHWTLTTPLIVQERGGNVTTDFGVLTTSTHEEIGLHAVDANYDNISSPFIIPKASSASEILTDAVATFDGTAVAYEQEDASSLTHTFLRWYGADGTPSPSDNQLGNPGESGVQQDAKLLSDGVNGVYAVYGHVDPSTEEFDIRFEQLSPNGINSNAIGVSGAGIPFAAFPDMAKLPDGSLIIVWQDSQGIALKHMLPNGIVLDQTMHVPGSAGGFLPKVAALNDGSFVVAWTAGSGTEADGSPNEDIFLSHFTITPQSPGSSTKIINSPSTPIHLAEPGDQGLFQTSMQTLADGRVVLAYATETGDSTNINNLAYRILDFRSPILTGGDLGNTVTVATDGATGSGSGGTATGLPGLTGTLTAVSSASASALSLSADQFTQAVSANPQLGFITGTAADGMAAGASGPASFVISTIPGDSSGVQHMANFDPSSDMILLAKEVFSALVQGGLPASAFFEGPAAHNADDRIIYNPSNGALSYDSNGSAPGGSSVIAILQTGLTLHAGNFATA
jgi:hypothetical protein